MKASPYALHVSPNHSARRDLFLAYNFARKLARAGYFDEGRLNRGFGLAMRKGEAINPEYRTELGRCLCPDKTCRKVTCKHQLALMLLGAVEGRASAGPQDSGAGTRS